MEAEQPIGIFDSGIGGLTVARAVREQLPNEQIIYFGDTAHLPYGDKSASLIQAYSIKVVDILLKQRCKLILIACNSASSVAFELIRDYCGSRAHVFDVINPMVRQLASQYRGGHVGLIGTKQTIEAQVYERKLRKQVQNLSFSSLATPLLVPMIEEGFFENKISHDIITEYLLNDQLVGIDQLILGCTHYPVIQKEIEMILKENGKRVAVLDSAGVVAKEIDEFLKQKELCNPEGGADRFIVSDYTHSFDKTAQIFFDAQVNLEHFEIWD